MNQQTEAQADFDATLAAARAGDEAAWSRVYRDLAPAVNGYLRLRGAESPEDLVGETFLQVARGIGTFTGPYEKFRSWVFVIAHHRLIDSRRRRGRRPQLVDVADHEVRDPSPTPEHNVVDMMQFSGVASRLDILTDDQRDVLLLRVMGGLSVAEVAAATGKRAGAVRVIHHRALTALRERYSASDVTDAWM